MPNQNSTVIEQRAEPRIIGKYRRSSKGPAIEEIRVTVVEFKGDQYLDLRVWEQGRNRQWFPTTRGVRFRSFECDDLADVIKNGREILSAKPAPKPNAGPKEIRPARPEPSRSIPPWEPISV